MRRSFRRFLTTAAALALILSVPAGTNVSAQSTVFSARYGNPDVDVIVPETGAAFINPYGMSARIGRDEDDCGQVLSIPSSIVNVGDVPLQVDVAVSGRIMSGSDMTLSTSSTTEDPGSTWKKVFMYFEMKNVSVAQGEDPSSVRWDGVYNEETDLVVKDGKQTKIENLLTLGAAKQGGAASANSSAAFHLTGDAVKNPASSWSEKDGVEVTVTFTFKPLARS